MSDRPTIAITPSRMQYVSDLDPNMTVWRYLTFQKFVSLITTSAVWFTKLQVFIDGLEGVTPNPARSALMDQHRDMEAWFPDEKRKRQIRQSLKDNEEYGRELIVASCWFISDHESIGMWNEYAPGPEGVVIRSTAGDLAHSLILSHNQFWIGKVNYVDLDSYDGMNPHKGSQAHLRAFLKSEKYSEENELRMATMNWVAPGCLNPDGSPPNERQRAGLVYSTDRSGIFVRAKLPTLIRQIRTAPGVTDSHRTRVDLLRSVAGLHIPVGHSELT